MARMGKCCSEAIGEKFKDGYDGVPEVTPFCCPECGRCYVFKGANFVFEKRGDPIPLWVER